MMAILAVLLIAFNLQFHYDPVNRQHFELSKTQFYPNVF